MPKRTVPSFFVIDSTRYSAVVSCRMCPWRAFAHTKSSAYRLVADHLRRTHGAAEAARDADRSAGRTMR